MADTEIEVHINTFERIAHVSGWPRTDWGKYFASTLTGKAQEAYARMDLEESADYENIKEAPRVKFGHNSEYYRRGFRTCMKEDSETFKEWSTL